LWIATMKFRPMNQLRNWRMLMSKKIIVWTLKKTHNTSFKMMNSLQKPLIFLRGSPTAVVTLVIHNKGLKLLPAIIL
jgi:hypothetical protein